MKKRERPSGWALAIPLREWAAPGLPNARARCVEVAFPLGPQPCPPLKEHWGQATRAAEYLFGRENSAGVKLWEKGAGSKGIPDGG